MAGKIRAIDIEEVKSRVNIADVIGEYVSLRNASVGSLKGLCPFHDEKSPSFNVRPAQGFYHCFGCGEGGDVYKFLQQMEQLSFTESVEKLAARIGFNLTYEEGGASQETGQRARILEANNAAATYFQSQLMTDAAIPGRDFLKSRGFDKDAATLFGIGFAPKGWTGLFEHLQKLGFTPDELLNAGLVSRSEKGTFDKFRGRLIWPIRDATSQVIGFGARKLFDDDNGPKYLNTSDTIVYHKSQVLYGLDLAKKEIAKKQQVVVVEGYTDVMACHLAGITTAVATCGTAFGDDHIRIINRLLSAEKDTPAEVIFTFDPDAAGQKAAMRAYADSHKFAAQTFVAVGPEGLDPCDLRSNRGDEAVVAMLNAKKPLFEFAIKQKLAKFDLNTIEGRVAAARAAATVVAAIQDAATKSAYVRELAGWVSLDTNEIASLVDAAGKTARATAVRQMNIGNYAPGAPNGEEKAPKSQEPPADEPVLLSRPNLNDPIVRFERQVLEVLIQLPKVATKDQRDRILGVGFSDPSHSQIGTAVAKVADGPVPENWLASIAAVLPESIHPVLRELAAQPLPAANSEALARYGQGVIAKALIGVIGAEKTLLLSELRRTDAQTESEKYRGIQRRLLELETERRNIREV